MAKQGGDKITRFIVIGMVALVVIVGVFFSMNSGSKKSAIPVVAESANGYAISFNADVKGVPVVDLWEDFQCPVCQRFEGTNGAWLQKQIAAKTVKVSFHLLSFLGPESILMANAAACAADDNKFLELHNLMYANQSAKENSGFWTPDILTKAGTAVGITSPAFAACVKEGKYLGWVQKVADDGAKKNVNSTPTLFVNGKELNRQTQYYDAKAFEAVVLANGK